MSERELSARIDVLETRLTFQDATTEQWQKIDALTRQLARLSERLTEAEANAPGPTSERPPHY
jgi:SlyX protein